MLGALFLWSEYFSESSKERSFRSIVLEVDTSAIDGFTIQQPKDTGGMIKFSRNGEKWEVSQGRYTFAADPQTVRSFLGQFERVPTSRYAGPSESVQQRYEITKEQARVVNLELEDGETIKVLIGKLSYKNDPSGQQQAKVSYLRVDDEEDVYEAVNTLGNDVATQFNMWRPRYLWRGGAETWGKVVLREGENAMILEKRNDVWMMNQDTVIPERMDSYLRALSTAKVAFFNNEADITGLQPIKQVVIHDSRLDGPRAMNIYQLTNGKMVLNSEMNPESVFQFTMDQDYRRMFRPPSYFIPIEKLKDNPELQLN